MEIQKEYNLRYLLDKSVLHEEKRRTGSDSGRRNATKFVSDVFRHWSGKGKSYCRTRFDVGSERVNVNKVHILYLARHDFFWATIMTGLNRDQHVSGFLSRNENRKWLSYLEADGKKVIRKGLSRQRMNFKKWEKLVFSVIELRR
jgi:hypothetical protein